MGYQNLKRVEVLNYPGATSSDIAEKIDDVLDDCSKSLIVYVGTNDLTRDMNRLNNIKKIVAKTKKKSPNTALSFSNIIICKYKKKLGKLRAGTNSRLKNYCIQKNNLTNNNNLKKIIWGSRNCI